jgi:ABC-type transporter Mla MlaB component
MKVSKQKRAAAAPLTETAKGNAVRGKTGHGNPGKGKSVKGNAAKSAVARRVAVIAEPAIVDVPVSSPLAMELPVANAPEAATAAADISAADMPSADMPNADMPSADMDSATVPSANIPSVTIPIERARAAIPSASPMTSSDPVVMLGSSCTVKDAAALKHSLCAVVDSKVAVTLDARSLERIDTATIQVLCAFVRQRVAAAHGVIWVGVPEALQEAARLLGVHALLALPPDVAGAAS